ncbi:YceK/YidQ family lipoprotein [Yersinia pseudotuberculosis]|uniref:Putative lipoprotein n=1 Tax=Yersinia pseudotuberculosis TaxID=633 RepID=A0A0T9J9S0_YERPU|nr:YceK/YidQ family lipoprotein [Yersinia pseudotuberculosis]PSH22422.1 YceK/YidQ family lipoprotein [Yersinia pseudotuberculosis]CNC12543.1 putative lipoprotein [Yersinia pseudotuberculosis]SUP81760.1 putative lipoprotein [Yersinia pseudotuberculosis]
MNSSKYALIFFVAINSLLISGCASVIARNTNLGITPPAVYPGTVYDIAVIPSPLFPLALIDLPLSFVADTLMLPIDIYHSSKRSSYSPKESVIKEKPFKTGDMYLTNMVSQNYKDDGVSLVKQGNDYYNSTPPDYAKAIGLYEQAAKYDDAAAQFNLGNANYLGRGTSINYEAAYTWYLKSANSIDNHDSSPSSLNIGNLYYNGLHVKKDDLKAIDWYLKATNCRNKDDYSFTYCDSALQARISLGDIYYNGTGVTRDSKTAYAWYSLAQNLHVQMVPQKEKVRKELSHDDLKEAKIIANKLASKYGLAYAGAMFTDSQIESDLY